MYRFLARPRWIAFGLFVVAMVVACLLLSRWQVHRLHQREAYNAVINQNIDQAPVSPSDLLVPGKALPSRDLWRSVAVSGRYDAAHVLLVRKRVADGQPGFYVMTPFRGQDGVGLWVNRGWIPPADTATSAPNVPPTPAGTVTIVARMRYSEKAKSFAPADLPAGQIDRIDVPAMSAGLGYATYGGYAEVITEHPQTVPAPTPIDPPEVSDGPHLSYAVQWVMFAVIGLFGSYVMVRKEADRIADERSAAVSGPDPDPDPEPVDDDARTPAEGNA